MVTVHLDTRAFIDWAVVEGLAGRNAVWTRLRPGQTNRVWQVGVPDATAHVIKLYRADRATPVFPNDPDAEWRALHALGRSGLAPEPLRQVDGPFGTVVSYVFSVRSKPVSPIATARLLSRLHRQPPIGGFRSLQLDAETLVTESKRMAEAADQTLQAMLYGCRPTHPGRAPQIAQTFLHGDPVPSNLIGTSAGPILVDWQCPATGDPVFDIACAVSPSMRLSCGHRPLSRGEVFRFLDAYGDAAATRRFHHWRPILTWRFACYAAWRMSNRRGGRRACLDAELALLERLDQ